MKDKFSLITIATKNLKQNKKTYILLLLSVIVTISFMSTILILVTSFNASVQKIHETRYGIYDYLFYNTNELPLDDLLDYGVIDEYGISKTLGYALVDGKHFDNGFSIAKYDEKALKLSNKQLIEGSFPSREGEIAIERTMLSRLRIDAEIGDTITLSVTVPDGESLLKTMYEKEYTLTGILKDQYLYMSKAVVPQPVYADFPAAIVSQAEEIDTGGFYINNCYGSTSNYKVAHERLLKLSNDNTSEFYRIFDVDKSFPIQSVGVYDYMAQNMRDSRVYMIFVVIFAIVFLLVSMLGIITVFSTNVDKRKQQIGMYRAVGATNRQLRKVLLTEILFLSAISIPVGIGFSLGLVKIAAYVIGDIFVLQMDILIIALIAVFSLGCVIISSLFPLIKTKKITPMQAIKDVELLRKLKKKKVKNTDIYVPEKFIAKRHVKLYNNRMWSTSILISLSVVLLLWGVWFVENEREGILDTKNYFDYSIMVFDMYNTSPINYSDRFNQLTNKDILDIQNIIGDGYVLAAKQVRLNLLPENTSKYINILSGRQYYSGWNDENSDYHELYLSTKEKLGFENDFITASCMAVDENMIKELESCVYDGEINLDKILSGEQIIIEAPKNYGIQYDGKGGSGGGPVREGETYDEVYENDLFKAGDKIDISYLYTEQTLDESMYDYTQNMPTDIQRKDATVEIGALVDIDNTINWPFNNRGMCNVIIPFEVFDDLGYETSYDQVEIELNYEPDKDKQEYLNQALIDITNRFNDSYFSDRTDNDKQHKKDLYMITIFLGSIVLLFTIVSISMINNAISANIRSSKVMISTLRAVGATKDTVKKIYNNQLKKSLLYGIFGGIIICLGLIAYHFIYNVFLIISYRKVTLEINWIYIFVSLIIYVLVLFAVGYMNINTKINKLLNNSIAQSIHEL